MLFVVAEEQEAKYLIEYYKLSRVKQNFVNLWSDKKGIQLVITGAGICNVISSLSRVVQMDVLTHKTDVINVGYAGSKGLEVGKAYCVRSAICKEFPKLAKVGTKEEINLCNGGYNCYSSIDFVESADGIENKALFDMEIAYIARFLHKSLYSIKIVSDNLDYEGFRGFDSEKAWKQAIKKIEKRRKELDVSRELTA